MLCFSLKYTSSTTSPQPLSAPPMEFRSSVRRFLEKRRKSIDTSNANVPVLCISVKCQPRLRTVATIDPEDLKALQVLYDALHHPSILDAKRQFRFGLSPLVAKTPPSTITLIVNPRCNRTVFTSFFYSTQVFPAAKHPPITYTRLTTAVSHAFQVMDTADLQVVRFLGKGTSGKVYLVRDSISKVKLALKVIPKKGRNDYALNTILKERNVSVKLSNSPWFVNIWAAWHDQLHFYIAMTVYPTDLDSEIIRCGVIDAARARFYMAEIIIALTELHSRGIIHRDIKAPNILIDRSGHVVLADFGLSKDFHKIPSIAERVYQPYWPYLPDDNPTSETEPRDPEELHFVAWNYRGSDLEMAPEIHLRMPYSFGVDFWSASVILYWMLTGRPPFYEDETDYEDGGAEDCKPLMYKIAEDDLYWDESDNVDEITKDFLERMLAKDPKKRLMISFDMPAHPYFTGLNWTLMEERLMTPPWIPGSKISHVYEDTSPTFIPGEPYLEGEDPFPDFYFCSQQLETGAMLDDDDVTITEGQQRSEVETVHVNDDEDDGSDGSYDMISWDELPVLSRNQNDDHDHASEREDDNFNLMAIWDISIINPPATKPYGPGPKSWIHALDLLKFRSAAHVNNNPHTLEFLHTLSPGTPYSTTGPFPGPHLKSPNIVPSRHHEHHDYHHQTTHVVNGVGFMFKIKVWIWKIWNPKPKPKKNNNCKRFSLLI